MSPKMRPDGSDGASAVEPSATIVVVARERFGYSQTSLENLYANTQPPFSLIYVDGGSPSHIKRYLERQARDKRFHLIRTKQYLSPNQARNIGLRAAMTKYVVFVDNDVEVKPGWLPALLQCAEETNASLVGPLYCIGQPVHQVIHMAGGEARIGTVRGQRRLHEELRLCDQRVSEVLPHLRREPSELIEFHCMLARRDVFERLGPLDEGLLGTREHVDICLKVRAAGGAVWLEPKAVVTHAPDSVWPTVPPSFAWSEIPYYLLRWSDDWGQSSLVHFERKWNLDASRAELTTDWLRPHRQIPLLKLRKRLHRLLGAKLADRMVDALEDSLMRRALRKGRRSKRIAGDPQAAQI
jgi:GT2 family glycosyltransferase